VKLKRTAYNLEIISSALYEIIRAKGVSNALMEAIGEKPNPFKGQCYVVSALLYDIFDGEGLELYRKKDFENQYHWWIKTLDGHTIDITGEQYEIQNQIRPSSSYDGAEKAKPMWFPSYKKRMEKLKEELKEFISKNDIKPE